MVAITEDWDEGAQCYKISTETATYWLQQNAGGFSSIQDRDGVDWVNFRCTSYGVPGDASGGFRGLPNLVWPDNVGHPGHNHVVTTRVSRDALQSVSHDGRWRWQWIFEDSSARLSVLDTPEDQPYWFLYEGTQGGSFRPEHSFWGTDVHGRRRDMPWCLPGGIPPFHDRWRWIYFGTDLSHRVFVAGIHGPESPVNLMAYMGSTPAQSNSPDGMTVFGFGRGAGPSPTLLGANSFTIGFIESTDHDLIVDRVRQLIP